MSPFGQRSLDDKLKWTAGCIECQQETTGQSSSLRQLLPSSRPSFTRGNSLSFSTRDWCLTFRSHPALRASGSGADLPLGGESKWCPIALKVGLERRLIPPEHSYPLEGFLALFSARGRAKGGAIGGGSESAGIYFAFRNMAGTSSSGISSPAR